MKKISSESSSKHHNDKPVYKTGTRSDSIRSFRGTIYRYYKNNNRNNLPWRKTKNPYFILVSEFMLQQTQVERVLGKYDAFIGKFPDFLSLSNANLQSVLAAWQGLGYNRRALALKKTASEVKDKWEGKLTSSVEVLMTFPGIGRATASAICAFAFNQPVVFIETNIRRVFIHFFFKGIDNVEDKHILPLVEKTLDKANPREWYYALMDYGAMLGRSTENPNRRSRHYQKQSPFKNSDRQLRGMVLRMLAGEKYLSDKEILLRLGTERERADRILQRLIHEGFIRRMNKGLTIV